MKKILECSSKGDKRFSAFYAKLSDGRTIEEHYQCDVKGYDIGGKNWKLGKGNQTLKGQTKEQIIKEYDNLWIEYLKLNPDNIIELKKLKKEGYIFNDVFAHGKTPNQADSLYRIIDEL